MAAHPTVDEPLPARSTPAVRAVIASSLAVLVLQLGGPFAPAEMRALLGYQADGVAGQWWTLLTHLFVQPSAAVAACTLVAIRLFGPRLEAEWGTRRFMWFFLWCGLGGVLLHTAVAPHGPPLMGAAAASFGIMFAYTWRWRQEELRLLQVITIPARVAIVLLALGTILATPGLLAVDPAVTPGAGALAPLGGFALAFVAVSLPKRTSLEQFRQRISPVPDVPEEQPPRAVPKLPPRPRERPDEIDEIVARSKAAVAKRPPAPRTVTPARRKTNERDRGDEVDRVLDKISQHGMESLTHEERGVLERYSKRLRGGE